MAFFDYGCYQPTEDLCWQMMGINGRVPKTEEFIRVNPYTPSGPGWELEFTDGPYLLVLFLIAPDLGTVTNYTLWVEVDGVRVHEATLSYDQAVAGSDSILVGLAFSHGVSAAGTIAAKQTLKIGGDLANAVNYQIIKYSLQ